MSSEPELGTALVKVKIEPSSDNEDNLELDDHCESAISASTDTDLSGDAESKIPSSEEEADFADNDEHVSTALELSTETIIDMARSAGVEVDEEIAAELKSASMNKLRYLTMLAIQFSQHENSSTIRVTDFEKAEETSKIPRNTRNVRPYSKKPEVPIDLLDTLRDERIHTVIIQKPNPILRVHFPNFVDLAPQEVDGTEESKTANSIDNDTIQFDVDSKQLYLSDEEIDCLNYDSDEEYEDPCSKAEDLYIDSGTNNVEFVDDFTSESEITIPTVDNNAIYFTDGDANEDDIQIDDCDPVVASPEMYWKEEKVENIDDSSQMSCDSPQNSSVLENENFDCFSNDEEEREETLTNSSSLSDEESDAIISEEETEEALSVKDSKIFDDLPGIKAIEKIELDSSDIEIKMEGSEEEIEIDNLDEFPHPKIYHESSKNEITEDEIRNFGVIDYHELQISDNQSDESDITENENEVDIESSNSESDYEGECQNFTDKVYENYHEEIVYESASEEMADEYIDETTQCVFDNPREEVIYAQLDDCHTEENSDEYDIYENFEEELVYDGIETVNEDNDEEEILENPEEEIVSTDDEDVDVDEDLNQTQDLSPDGGGIAVTDEIQQDPSLNDWDVIYDNPTEQIVLKRNGDLKSTESIGQDESNIYDDPSEEFVCVKYSPTLPDSMNNDDEEHDIVEYVDANVQLVEDEDTESLSFDSDEYEYCDTEVEIYNENTNDVGNRDEKSCSHLDKDADLINDSVLSNDFELDSDDTQIIDLSDSEVEIELNSIDGELDDLGSTDKQNVKNPGAAVLREGKLQFNSAECTSSFDVVGIREDIAEEQTSGDDSDWETSDAESDWETSDGENDWETIDEEYGAEKYDQGIDQRVEAENSDSEIEVEYSDQEIELEKSDDEIESKYSDQEIELISDQEIEFETSDQEFELENSDFEIDGEKSDEEFEFKKSVEKIELENLDSFGLRHLDKDLEIEGCTQEIELESSDRQEINLDNSYHEIEVKQSSADVEFENLDDNVQHTDREINNSDHRINLNDYGEVIESEDSDVSISEDSDDVIISEDSDNATNSDDLDEGINSENSDGIINSSDSDEAANAQDSNELINSDNSDRLIIPADLDQFVSEDLNEVIEAEDYDQMIESEDYDQVIKSEDYDQVIESEDYNQVIEPADYDQVIESEDYDPIIESEDHDQVIESEDYDQVIQSEDYDKEFESEDYDPIIESEDHNQVIESENYDQVIESADYDEVIESEDYDEVIEPDDYDEVIESEDYEEVINSEDSDESIDLDESNTEIYLQDSDTIIDLDDFDPRDYMDTDSDSLENEEIESENVFLEFEGRNDPELEEQPYRGEIECQNTYEQGELEYSNPGVDYCIKEADAENSYASNIHSYEQSELSNPNTINCDMESSAEGAEVPKSIDASNIEYSNQGVDIEYSNEEMQLESFEYSNSEVEYEDPTQRTDLEVPDENYGNDDVDSSPSDEEILLLPNTLLYNYPYNEPPAPAPTETEPSSETVRSYVHNLQLFPVEDDECELQLERESNDSLSDSSEENCLELSPEIKEQTDSEESSSSESVDDVCNSNYKKQISFESIKLELENVEACIKCLNEDPGIKIETKGAAEKVEEVNAKEDKSKCTDLDKKPSASDIEDRCERKYNYVIELNSINISDPDSNCENDEIIEAQNFSLVLNEGKGKVRVDIKNIDDHDASKFEYPNLLMVSEKYDCTEVSEFRGEENHDPPETIDTSIDEVESANDIIDKSMDEVENENNIDKSIDEAESANNTDKSMDEVESADNTDKSIDEVENAKNVDKSMDKVESTIEIDKSMDQVENSNDNDITSEENKVEEVTKPLDTLSQQPQETAVDYELPAKLQMTFDNSESAFNPSSPSDVVSNENDAESENSYEEQGNPCASDNEDPEDSVDRYESDNREVPMVLKHIPDQHRDDCEMDLVHAISDYVEDSSEESDIEGVMNKHIDNNAVFIALQRYPILPVEWRDYMKMFIHNFYRNGDTLENDADMEEFSIILKDLRTHGAFPVLDIICDLFLDFLLRIRNRLEHAKPLTETAKNSLSLITVVLNAILECRLHCSHLHLKMICSVLIGLLTLPVECNSQQPLIQAFVKATVKYGDMLTWTKGYITETLSRYREVPLINISENSKSLIGAAVGLLNGLKTIHTQIVQDLSIHEELLLIVKKYEQIYSASSTGKCIFSENDSYIEQQLFEFFRSSIVNLNIKPSEYNPYCKLREIVQDTYGERVFTHTKIQEKSSKIDSRKNLTNKKGFRGSLKVRVKSDKSPHTDVNLPNLKFEKECSYPLNCIL